MAEMQSFYPMQNRCENAYPSAEGVSLQENSKTAFDFEMTEKEIDGAAGVDIVNRRVIGALMKRLRDKRITKGMLAKKLDIHRSQVSKLLRGDQNLTARTIGEILGALDYDFDISLEDRYSGNGINGLTGFNTDFKVTVRQSMPALHSASTPVNATPNFRAINSAQVTPPAVKEKSTAK